MKSKTDQPTLIKSVATSWCPGTCGELVQGFFENGQPFHVTLPIAMYSRVELSVTTTNSGIQIAFDGKEQTKTVQAIRQTARLIEARNLSVAIRQTTQLQVGKGMASSTADIVCAADALAQACAGSLTPAQFGQIAASIESSDGTMYPGIAAVNHQSGSLLQAYDWYPQFNVVMIIPEQTLLTESTNFEKKISLSKTYDRILDQLDRASAAQDESAFADAATQSAYLNQQFVTNNLFQQLYPKLNTLQALGMNIAHTGTVAGLLFGSQNLERHRAELAAQKLRRILADCTVEVTRIEGKRRWQATE